MPMFYTPKPRQFHYRPRFYDPEKEEWEQLKMKYKMQKDAAAADSAEDSAAATFPEGNTDTDKDLDYFQRRVRDIDRQERLDRQKKTVKDLFRRREKPTFHYVSRFDADGNLLETPPASPKGETKRRIQRRFDNADDWDRFKPVPAGKIITATLLVCLLLFFIFS